MDRQKKITTKEKNLINLNKKTKAKIKRRRKKKIRKKRGKISLMQIALILAAIYLMSVAADQSVLRNNLEAKIISSDEKIALLNEEIADLEKEVEESKSLASIERVARDELNMVKPREIIYIDKSKEELNTKDSEKPLSLSDKLWTLFEEFIVK